MKEIITVEEYINLLSSDKKKALEDIRSIIFSTIPEIKERIAYKICVFSVKRDLVGFASQKNHLSFYVMSPPLVRKLKDDLKKFNASGATIHFSPKKKIPKALVQKILKERLKEIGK